MSLSYNNKQITKQLIFLMQRGNEKICFLESKISLNDKRKKIVFLCKTSYIDGKPMSSKVYTKVFKVSLKCPSETLFRISS